MRPTAPPRAGSEGSRELRPGRPAAGGPGPRLPHLLPASRLGPALRRWLLPLTLLALLALAATATYFAERHDLLAPRPAAPAGAAAAIPEAIP